MGFPLFAIGAASILGYFLFKGTTLKESAENIRVSLLNVPKVHKIDLSGLKISLDLRVDNPAQGLIRLKIPTIEATYKGKLVASTPVNNTIYTIDPVSSGKITGFMIEANYISLIMAAPTIISDITVKGAAGILDNFGFKALAEVNGIPLKIEKL